MTTRQFKPPAQKLPDPSLPCEAHWSRSYKRKPNGECGRDGRFVVAFETTVLPCCGLHAHVVTEMLKKKHCNYALWKLLKRRARLMERR